MKALLLNMLGKEGWVSIDHLNPSCLMPDDLPTANDIALIELPENFNFSDSTIQSISIAEETDIPFGGKAIATGWGRFYTSITDYFPDLIKPNGSSPFILQEVAVDMINNTLCEVLVILPPEGEKAVSAFTPYKGPCSYSVLNFQGDRGSPLTAKLCNDRWVVFGISSHVSRSGCANATIPSVFTRVPPYRPWIDEKTGPASC
ncbi:chymotrypsin-C-like [Palaemon carinicauda]|uniref:chymotrypsin-C-like n=1 Tax=Palaemon carinicauda TaxID=392227 RepID=UPI0035B5DCB7